MKKDPNRLYIYTIDLLLRNAYFDYSHQLKINSKSLFEYQQATSYKSRIVFTQAQAAAETEAAEERSPKVLIDDSVVTNEIPDYELTKVVRQIGSEIDSEKSLESN